MTDTARGLIPQEYYLKQRDPRWSGVRLGFSKEAIGNYGCAITCVAVLLNYLSDFLTLYTPVGVNEKLKAGMAYLNTNRVNWPKLPSVFPEARLHFAGRIDCPKTPAPIEKIDALLAVGMPVIVKVDFDLKKPDLQEHFVIIHGAVNGNYIIVDPYKSAPMICPAYGRTPQIAVCVILMYEAIK